MENNEFENGDDQFVLSYELLQLMEWLVEREGEGLRKLIKKSLRSGLDKRLEKEKHNRLAASQAQNSIINFLTMLEVVLVDSTSEYSMDRIMEKVLIPAIDQVDTKACDTNTLKSSIAVATYKSERNPKQNVQEIFLKELLKQWKPSKSKKIVN